MNETPKPTDTIVEQKAVQTELLKEYDLETLRSLARDLRREIRDNQLTFDVINEVLTERGEPRV